MLSPALGARPGAWRWEVGCTSRGRIADTEVSAQGLGAPEGSPRHACYKHSAGKSSRGLRASPGGLAHPHAGTMGLAAGGDASCHGCTSPALACGERQPTLTCSDTGAPLS